MSVKFNLYMRPVASPEEKLCDNLRLKVTNTVDCFWKVADYDIELNPHPYFPVVHQAIGSHDNWNHGNFFRFNDHGDSWIRIEFFDFARAMGLHEMWFMDEYCVEPIIEEEFDTIEDLLTALKSFDLSLGKYDPQQLLGNLDANGYSKVQHERILYDDFHDLFERVERIEQEHGVHVLGLKRFNNDYIRVERDGNIELLKI